MNPWLVVLTSSAVGVLVGSLVTLLGQWLERRARRDEMLFRAALEISRVNAERAARDSDKFTPVLELSLIEKTFEVLKQVHRTGKMSEPNKTFLMRFLRRSDRDAPKQE